MESKIKHKSSFLQKQKLTQLTLLLSLKSVAMKSTTMTVPIWWWWYYGICILENTIQEISTSP